MLHPDPYSNVHLYGHYKVGNNVYYNKIDALSDHVRSSKPITWHILEEEMDRFDTTIEPSETIEELYAERARKIRERYDYLVIHFSGGTDSSKVVDIFYKNGIRIDEIFHRTYSEGERRKAFSNLGDPEAAEPELLTNPRLDFIKSNLWPDVKIRQVDITQDMIKSFNKGNWFKEKRFSSSDVSVAWRTDWEISVPEWLTLTNKGMKVGHIIGKEKPLVYKDDVGYYFTFSDNFVNSWIAPRNVFVGYPSYKEFFYLHPDCCKMIIKQAHLLKNHCSKESWLFDHALNDGGRRRENAISKVIYGETIFKSDTLIPKEGDRKRLLHMHLGKVTSGTGWWITKDRTSEQFKHYAHGLHDLYQELKPYYNNFLDFYQNGLPKISAKKHYISYHNA